MPAKAQRIELSDAELKRLTREAKERSLPDRFVGDSKAEYLYVRLLPSGKCTFYLRKRIGARMHVQRLGEWRERGPHMEVAQARKQYAIAYGKLESADHSAAPVDRRRTVRMAADAFYKARIEKRRRRPLQAKQYLDRDLASIASMPLAKVTRAHVKALVLAKPMVAGNRLLSIVKQMFRHALDEGWLPGDPLSNLTRGNVGDDAREEVPRGRVLTDDEIRRAWAVPAPHGTLYRMLLATGQRLGEVLALASEPEQVQGATSHIVKNKTGNTTHKVPVTPLMTTLLAEGLPSKARSTAWQHWRRHMGKATNGEQDVTLHDARRTVASRMRELGIRTEAIEALLNHTLPGMQGVYQGAANMQPAIAEALAVWHKELLRIVAS